MNSILLAPHSDDQDLFANYIIQRTKPLIVVCTDGTSHEKKFGIPIEQRRQESRDAAKILGVDIKFLGIAEEQLTGFQILIQAFLKQKIYGKQWDFVFVPRKEGGNPHHDIVSGFGEHLRGAILYYGTYTKDRLYPDGEMMIQPTSAEIEIKKQALTCYTSQLRINPHHFEAIKGVPEYLSFSQC